MNRLEILYDGTPTTVSLDDPIPCVDRMCGIIGMRLVDEVTGQPPRKTVSLTTTYPRLTARVAEDGVVGLAGIPRDVFPALDTTNYTVAMTIRVPGYVQRKLTETFPSQPAFPAAFSPMFLPDLRLHRLPVRIRGRIVLRNAATITPVAGAAVRVTGIWRTPPPAAASVPADPPNLIYLEPPIYAEHAAATGSVERFTMTPVLGDDKLLLQPYSASTKKIRLSNTLNVSPGDILLLDADLPDRSEYLAVHSIQGGSTPDQEAEITLDHSTAYAHRKHAVIRRVNPQPPGPTNSLSDAAIPGDAVAFLASMNGLSPAGQIRLHSSGTVEYHRVRTYTAVSDSAGYYRLPPVSRAAWIEVEADDSVHAAVKTVVSPDYERSENIADLVIM